MSRSHFLSRVGGYVAGTKSVKSRPLVGLSLVIVAALVVMLVAATAVQGGIVGIVPGSNTVDFAFSSGGVPFLVAGPLPLAHYPSVSPFTGADPPTGFGTIALSYGFSPGTAKVFIPNTGPVAIASQGAPAPLVGAMETLAEFSVSFDIDAGGTPAAVISIAYPIVFGQSAPGMFDSFDAEIDYTSAALGFLGTSEVHFAFAAGPGGGAFTLTGLDLALPALPALDTLTLDGYFKLIADGHPGGSTEIEVFGIPEPASATLLALGCLAVLVMRRRRAL
jgi:hypothetical protein